MRTVIVLHRIEKCSKIGYDVLDTLNIERESLHFATIAVFLTRRWTSSADANRETSRFDAIANSGAGEYEGLASGLLLPDEGTGSVAVSKSMKAYLRSGPRTPAKRTPNSFGRGTMTSMTMF